MEQTLTDIYHFLFETFAGIAILVGVAIVASIVACAVMERRYKKAMREKQAALAAQEEAEWNFDDDEEESEG